MDNYKIILIKSDSEKYDITSLVGNMSWKDNIDTLGMEFNFDVARNLDDRFMVAFDIVETKNKVVLFNNDKEIFRGIIVDENIEKYKKTFTAYDYAFYLNKSKDIFQFNKISASNGIKQICNRFNIPVGIIVSISTPITKIYKDNTISDVIKDILEQATKELGQRYNLEMRQGKLYIEKHTDMIVKGYFKPSINLEEFDITQAIGNINRRKNIVELKNSILITSNNEKSVRVVGKAQYNTSIADIGLLQEIESVEDKDIAKATNIAKNKLKELNKVQEDISVELLGDDNIRSGRIIEIVEKHYGLNGKYLIKDCNHTYNNGIHKMNLTLGVI